MRGAHERALRAAELACQGSDMNKKWRMASREWIGPFPQIFLACTLRYAARLSRFRDLAYLSPTKAAFCLLLPLLSVLSFSEVRADSISYAYDSLGRVIQATNSSSGQAVVYTYDAAGNILSQNIVALTTLSVTGFSPGQGSVGTSVILGGTGFSSTLSANTVTFNGTAAVVTAAKTTELVVTVPSGATTGLINVAVGALTANSASAFVVGDSGMPTITGFSPTIGVAGTAVSITGANFDPTGNNKLGFGNSSAQASAATLTSIGTSVPAAAASGRIRVTTASGTAVSAADFIVPPSGYAPGSVGSTGRMSADGVSTTISLATANQIAMQLFEGAAGDLLTLGVNSTSLPSCTIKVFKPDGTLLMSGSITASGQGLRLPKLPATGTYSIVLYPGSSTGSVSLAIYRPLQGTLALDGAATTINLTPPGRRALLTFNGNQGAYVTVTLSNATIAGGTISILGANGAVLVTRSFTTSIAVLQPQLPSSGTYSVVIDPNGSLAGSFQLAASTTTPPTLSINQASIISLTAAGATRTFSGLRSQRVAIALGQSGAGVNSATLTVSAPDGSIVCSRTMNSLGVVCDVPSLPVSGTYSVKISTFSQGNVLLALSTPVQASMDPASPTISVPLSVPGQGAYLTFAGLEGEVLTLGALQTTSADFSGAGFTVVSPTHSELQTTHLGLRFQGDFVANTIGPLPLYGTYTVFFKPSRPAAGTIAFTLSRPAAAGNLAFDNITTNTVIARRGQGVTKTFVGARGQPISFRLSEVNGGITNLRLKVITPSGQFLTSFPELIGSCLSYGCGAPYKCENRASPCDIGPEFALLEPLAESGVHTIELLQTTHSWNAGAGTGTLSFMGVAPATGTLTVNGPDVSLATATPWTMQLGFSAVAGQSLKLTVLASTSHYARQGTVWVLAPDGSVVASRTYSMTPPGGGGSSPGSFFLDTGILTTSGGYSVVLQSPRSTGTFSFRLTTN